MPLHTGKCRLSVRYGPHPPSVLIVLFRAVLKAKPVDDSVFPVAECLSKSFSADVADVATEKTNYRLTKLSQRWIKTPTKVSEKLSLTRCGRVVTRGRILLSLDPTGWVPPESV